MNQSELFTYFSIFLNVTIYDWRLHISQSQLGWIKVLLGILTTILFRLHFDPRVTTKSRERRVIYN